ncbi:hypothetical protein BuS5_03880 [Desulfosarcina sp. BuS5]|uniref:hypothetical protein n=1 Tax=Desulfosarcina sp. BuS5 TaxID=933262 RepID=UPI00237962AE|nr:hypothetical protein [Desulfosarcina sp. BuS5]WDN90909.1 hypothetical protein BuS5_03880 [Desulfosarcina sp. BuS5]
MDFESSFELISQSEDVLVFYRFLGSLEVRTKRWRGLGRSSAFRKGNFLTEFYNLIIALGLLCPAPQLSVLTLALLTGGFGEGLPEFFLVFDFCFSLEAVYFVSFWKFQFKEIESCSMVVCSFGN